MKTSEPKTCPRCKGKGIGNWVVVHGGVPGLCYQCDGSGKVRYLTKDEKNEFTNKAFAGTLERISEQAEEKKAQFKDKYDRCKARAERAGKEIEETYDEWLQGLWGLDEKDGTRADLLERHLDQLREQYRHVLKGQRLWEKDGKLPATYNSYKAPRMVRA